MDWYITSGPDTFAPVFSLVNNKEMQGGNWANTVSDAADVIGTTASVAGLASGATGIGAPALPFLEGIAGAANLTSAVTGLFGDGLSSSKMADWADDDDTVYEDLQRAVKAVGRMAGIESKRDAQQAAVDAYWQLVEAEGTKHLNNDEYYSGLSPNKMMKSIGVDPGPAEEDDPTPRTQQLISEGVLSPPAGPGTIKGDGLAYVDWQRKHGDQLYNWAKGKFTGDGLSVSEVIAASQNLREAPETRALYTQKLVRPEQVADARFVSNLEYTLQSQAKKKRRHSTVPALQRQTREHRPKLKYYRGVTFAKK